MFRYVAFSLVLCSFAACQPVAVQAAEDTGIEGTVLWGPVQPGPSTPGQSDEEPLAASFIVYSGDTAVANFRSDEMGKFRLALSPGDYTIVPASGTPVPRPDTQVTRVTVPSQGYVSVQIRLDTGMR